MAHPYAQTTEEVLRELGTQPSGLTRDEVERRLKETGPNILPKEEKVHPLLILLSQFRSLVVYVLLGATLLSLAFAHWIDAGVILVVIFLNVIIGFLQTYRAERAIGLLKRLIVSNSKVVRGGRLREVRSRNIVPGDILFVETGDHVPADARIIDTKNLATDESSLTGESLPVGKITDQLPEETPIAERKNMIWTGTAAVEGKASAVVVTTGRHTEFGKIARAVQKIKRPKTHFEKKAGELVTTMVIIASLGAFATFLVGYGLRGIALFDILLFSVASLVSGIPEGLPAALAIVLAVGSWRMARRKAIIRRLPATETLGAVDVILTDKTGTLTQNKMEALRVILYDTEITIEPDSANVLKGTFEKDGGGIIPLEYAHLAKLLHVATLANNASVIQDGELELLGNPTELAMLLLGMRADLSREVLSNQEREMDEIPFNQDIKLHSILVERSREHTKGEREIYVAGAFERVMEKSTTVLAQKGVEPLDGRSLEYLLSKAEHLMAEGYRLIGVGYRGMPHTYNRLDKDDIESLTFVGIIALSDPIREEVPEAIEKAQNAGIRVIMITGDHQTTALSIARSIGLIPPDVTKTEGLLLTENEVQKLSDEMVLEKLREGVLVFARVTPVTKLRVTKLLQQAGHLVAVTGDGTNDAPALKQADIGVAMGKVGTDVARESAEMVLVDDNFASIVAAIEEGRVVFNNIRQVSFFLVSTNVAEDITILSALGLGLGLPLLPIHILWLNLVTDGTLVPPLALEPGHDHLLGKPPRPKEPIITFEIVPILLMTGVLMATGTLFLYQAVGGGTDNPEHARTIAFTTMAFFQVFNALNLRSLRRSYLSTKPLSNRWLVWGIAASITIQILVVHLPSFVRELSPSPAGLKVADWLHGILRFDALNLKEWFLVVLVSSSVFFAVEAYKYIRNKIRKLPEER